MLLSLLLYIFVVACFVGAVGVVVLVVAVVFDLVVALVVDVAAVAVLFYIDLTVVVAFDVWSFLALM